MFEEIPQLDRKGLRNFGLMFGAFLVGIFGLLLPWLRDAGFPAWPWVVATGVAVFSLAFPDRLERFYRLWMRFGMAIGSVVTRVILGIVFFGVIMPMGLVMRLAGKDPMDRTFDEESQSYRVASGQPRHGNMEKPF